MFRTLPRPGLRRSALEPPSACASCGTALSRHRLETAPVPSGADARWSDTSALLHRAHSTATAAGSRFTCAAFQAGRVPAAPRPSRQAWRSGLRGFFCEGGHAEGERPGAGRCPQTQGACARLRSSGGFRVTLLSGPSLRLTCPGDKDHMCRFPPSRLPFRPERADRASRPLAASSGRAGHGDHRARSRQEERAGCIPPAAAGRGGGVCGSGGDGTIRP